MGPAIPTDAGRAHGRISVPAIDTRARRRRCPVRGCCSGVEAKNAIALASAAALALAALAAALAGLTLRDAGGINITHPITARG